MRSVDLLARGVNDLGEPLREDLRLQIGRKRALFRGESFHHCGDLLLDSLAVDTPALERREERRVAKLPCLVNRPLPCGDRLDLGRDIEFLEFRFPSHFPYIASVCSGHGEPRRGGHCTYERSGSPAPLRFEPDDAADPRELRMCGSRELQHRPFRVDARFAVRLRGVRRVARGLLVVGGHDHRVSAGGSVERISGAVEQVHGHVSRLLFLSGGGLYASGDPAKKASTIERCWSRSLDVPRKRWAKGCSAICLRRSAAAASSSSSVRSLRRRSSSIS